MQKINQFDKKCLSLSILAAKKAFSLGNYPVGAVLLRFNLSLLINLIIKNL